MDDIEKMVDRIKDLSSLGHVNDNEILKAEEELSISFSPEYKKYTSEYGAISFGEYELSGVVQSNHLNVVSLTEAARAITPQAHPDWYVIMDPCIEGIIIWQGAEGTIYQTEPNKPTRQLAESLAEYISSIT